jgi:4-carboxymuconolactone decarboxylase
MTRLKPLDTGLMTDRQKQVYDAIVSGPRGQVRGPLAVWLYRPELASKAQKLGQYCRYDSALPPRLSELAILTTARIWDAAFEWQAHVPHALAGGIMPAVIASLESDETPQFDKTDEAVVYAFARELNMTRAVTDETFDRTIACLGADATVDLVGVLGYYALISMTIKAFDLPGLHDGLE